MQATIPTTHAWHVIHDGELVYQAQQGSQEAFELLVERYRIPLASFISRYISDYDQRSDMVQQVLIQLYLSLPKLRTEGSLQSWLFQVARNRCIDELRRTQRRHYSYLSELEERDELDEQYQPFELLSSDPSLEEMVEQQEVKQKLYTAIQHLPPHYRRIVWLRYTASLSFVEIGHAVNIPENTAKTYFYRAKDVLRRLLTGAFD